MTDSHTEPAQSGELLDPKTEKAILDFERAVSVYSAQEFHDHYVRKHARDGLRSRIRTLVSEARQTGEAEGAAQVRRMLRLADGMALNKHGGRQM
jgi:hypothetical protein